MRYAPQKLVLLLAILWTTGCTTASTESVLPLEQLPATVQPLQAIPSPSATRPSSTPQPSPAAATQSPTIQSPTPPAPTQSPPAEEAAPAPQVISFSVTPATPQVNLGDSLLLMWEAVGDRVELCPIIGSGPVDCREVSPTGRMHLVTDQASLSYVGLGLRATSGEAFVWSIADITVGCQGLREWFFADPPARCPESEPVRSAAAAQLFQRGFMIWTETPDQFFIFYDERFSEDSEDPRKRFERILAPYTFGEERPLAETPPAGLQAPVSGFGKLWRGELDRPIGDPTIRERLGWAVGAEFSFDAAYQCEVRTHPQGWTCYLQVPDERILVLRPASTLGAHLLWQERE